MMKSILIFIITIASLKSYAQVFISCRNHVDTSIKPLYVVNNFQAESFNYFIINHGTIKSVDIFRGKEAIKKYGSSAKFAVIVAEMGDNIKLFNINQVLDYFEVECNDRDLPIFIDNKFIPHPDKIRADINQITSLKIVNGEESLSKPVISKRIINIKTKGR